MYSLKELASQIGCELLSPPMHGGSASVYCARCCQQNRQVALKLLHPGRDPDRLRKEAHTLTKLDHPSIVQHVRSGTVGGVSYLMTAWVNGVPLSRLLRPPAGETTSGLTLKRSFRLLSSIVNALNHAHNRQVVHGDLTPANILVTPRDHVVLVDFGGGHELGETTLTVHDDLIGSPRYLAPELIQGESPTPLSDQYAAAVLAYELITGQWPFQSKSYLAAAALHHQLYTQPTPISEHQPKLPIGVDAVFEKALAKFPEERFANIKDFLQALLNASQLPTSKFPTIAPQAPSVLETDNSFHAQSAVKRAKRRPSYWESFPRLSTVFCLCLVGFAPSNSWLAWSTVTEPDVDVLSLAIVPAINSDSMPVDAIVTDASTNSIEAWESLVDINKQCNLYPNARFDAELEPNFYRDPDNRDAALRSQPRSIGKADSSPYLQLGNIDVYGLYGVIVAIEGEQEYSFSAAMFFQEYVHKAELQIVWLDADWQTLERATEIFVIKDKYDGRFTLSSATAPADAHYAVPTIYKDASAGTVFADDIVFVNTSSACHDLIEQSK